MARRGKRCFRISLVWGVALAAVAQSGLANAALPKLPTDDADYVKVANDRGYFTAPACNLDQYGYCLRNCTSFVAQKLAAAQVKPALFSGLGHAKDWYTKTKSRNVPSGVAPRVGAVAFRRPVHATDLGHVAFVTAVYGDGSYDVQSYDGYREVPLFEHRTRRFSGFLYFPNVQPSRSQPKVIATQRTIKLTAQPKALPPQVPAASGNLLGPGQSLRRGKSLQSSSGTYTLLLQADGDLVVQTKERKIVWRTGTAGTGGDRLVMQLNGNLVLYAGTKPVWQTRTSHSGTSRLVLDGQGSVAVVGENGVQWKSFRAH